MLRWSRPLPGWERVGLAVSSLADWWVCVCVSVSAGALMGTCRVGVLWSWALS